MHNAVLILILLGFVLDIWTYTRYVDRQRPIYGPGAYLATLVINLLMMWGVFWLAGGFT